MYGLFQQTLIQGSFSAFFVGQRPKAFSAQFRVQARLKALLFAWSLKSKTYKKKKVGNKATFRPSYKGPMEVDRRSRRSSIYPFRKKGHEGRFVVLVTTDGARSVETIRLPIS